ncbi:5-formyltetrahydrofolate cyclo-ligase [uncultured Candidatus Thioglobus sp.]|nr:5-formyltetrahydrofolate cyclo-ligase [uncultured Candidatus Thioglobus sp.]
MRPQIFFMHTLRQQLRDSRNVLSVAQRKQSAKQLLAQVEQIAHFQKGQKIALYLANDGEIDPIYIINFLKNSGISVYLPILDGKSLKFSEFIGKLQKNSFGIDEPVESQVLNAEQLDIIFIPLVGFDKNKNRIGMGGGFYDRTLAFTKTQDNNPKLYGLAFDCQRVEKLDAQSWDVTLDAVITATTIYR